MNKGAIVMPMANPTPEIMPSQDFPRVKIGVGAKPHPEYDLADWVLSTFSAQEEKALAPARERAADAALCIMEKGIAEASNRYSGKA